ncbi:MAG: hypothetical protein ACLP2X_06530 [Syntrophobacteraceae bacterium]|jgi:hypothetical protein
MKRVETTTAKGNGIVYLKNALKPVLIVSIQTGIDVAIASHCNVLIPCSLSNEEIRTSVTNAHGCAIFWKKEGELILIAHPD